MISKNEQIRTAVAEQAADWFVVNDEGPLDAEQSTALVAWLKASPLHVEEFLGVAVIARNLREACADPEHSLDMLLGQAQVDDDSSARPFWPRLLAAVRDVPRRRWQTAAVAMAALGVVSLGLLLLWNLRPNAPVSAPATATALHFETRHGEQQTFRLADNSLLHLNTDTAVTILYNKTERLAKLTSGEAAFEIAHEHNRAFRVLAGAAEVVDLGTTFDVRLGDDATVVTVVEGRVAVGPSPTLEKGGTAAARDHARGYVELHANQQISVSAKEWPATLIPVDAQRATAWLHRQIAFDHEPLGRVVAEYNRYAPKPIEITTPALRNLEISGVFATDDSEEFIAFLRSLKGVRVEVTAARIRVSQK